MFKLRCYFTSFGLIEIKSYSILNSFYHIEQHVGFITKGC